MQGASPSSKPATFFKMCEKNLQILKPQARLTHDEVVEIFMSRATKQSASQVCMRFGVSEKAIRDIWTGRTWAKETWHLDKSRSIELKKIGRPVGCKDAKPRKYMPQKTVSSERDEKNAEGSVYRRHGQAVRRDASPLTSTFASQTGTSSTSDWRACESIDEELYMLEQAGQWVLVAFQQV
jgi:hypothetical protein